MTAELQLVIGLDRATQAALGPTATGELIEQLTVWSTVEAPDITPQVFAPDELVGYLHQQVNSNSTLVVIDAQFIGSSTLYGDVVAQPGAAARVLRMPDSSVVAVRIPPGLRLPEDLPPYPTVSQIIDGLAQQLVRGATHNKTRRKLDPPADLTTDPFPAEVLCAEPSVEQLTRALDQVDAADEIGLRLKRSARSDDGFLSTFLIRPLSWRVTGWAVGRGLRPAQITAIALALGLFSAGAFAAGWSIIGSLLLLISLVIDCVDGEVARFTRTASAPGAWLDIRADRIKEYAVYAGLAYGVAGSGRVEWVLALAAMGVLVTRHFVDFGYASAIRHRPPVLNSAVAAWSTRTNRRAWARYAKRAIIVPVGERTIVLALLAPTVGTRATFVVLLGLGLLAAAWTTLGRLGRMLRVAQTPRQRLSWLRPAAARGTEQLAGALVIGICVKQALPWAFAWLAVAAICEYEAAYRDRLVRDWRPRGPIRWLRWPGRNFLLSASVLPALLQRPEWTGRILFAGAVGLALWLWLSSWRFWRTQSVG